MAEKIRKPESSKKKYALHYAPCGRGDPSLEYLVFSRKIKRFGGQKRLDQIPITNEKLSSSFPKLYDFGVRENQTIKKALGLIKNSAFYAAASGKKEVFEPVLGMLRDVAEENENVLSRGCMAREAKQLHRTGPEEQVKFVREKLLDNKDEIPILVGEGHYLSIPAKKYPKGTKLIIFDRHLDLQASHIPALALSHSNFIGKVIADGLVNPKDIIIIGPSSEMLKDMIKIHEQSGIPEKVLKGVENVKIFHKTEVEDALYSTEGGRGTSHKGKEFLKALESVKGKPVHISFDIDAVKGFEGHPFDNKRMDTHLLDLNLAERLLKLFVGAAGSIERADFMEYNAAHDPKGKGIPKLKRLIQTVVNPAPD